MGAPAETVPETRATRLRYARECLRHARRWLERAAAGELAEEALAEAFWWIVDALWWRARARSCPAQLRSAA